MPPPLLGAGRWAGRSGAWGPSWCLVPLIARASCPWVDSGTQWNIVLSARNASRSLVLPRSLVVVVYFLGSCNGKAVHPSAPGLHSSVLGVPRCCLGFHWHPDCCSWGPGHSRGCTPSRSAGLQTVSRRTPCPWVLGHPRCHPGLWGRPGPCRCPRGLRNLGCRTPCHHIPAPGCSVRCTPGVLRHSLGQ